MCVPAALRSIVCSVFLLPLMAGVASAASGGGIDTPPGVPTLPIAVEGQTAITLNVDTSGATPPQPTVNFIGPINEGGATGTTITTTGQVGIGTTSPSAGLDVINSGLTNYYYSGQSVVASFKGSAVESDGFARNRVIIDSGSSNTGAEIDLRSSDPSGLLRAAHLGYQPPGWSNLSGTQALLNPHGLFTIWMPNLGNIFNVDATTGFVGIGTSSPQTNLEINGASNAAVSLFLDANGAGNIPQYLYFGENGTVEWAVAGGGFTNPKDNNLYIMNIPDSIAGIVDGGYVMTFAQNGNVGFGTTTPYAQLTVSSGQFGTYLGLENTAPGGVRWDVVSLGSPVPSPINPGSFAIQYQSTGFIPFLIEQPGGGGNGPSNIGINNVNPLYALDVSGTVNATGGAGALSDRRHKKDIAALNINGIEAVEKLKPVNFRWRDPTDDGMKGQQIGFIAQDVQQILPDTILTANNREKTLSIKYDELIPVLTKAIQEQQAEIAAQNARIEALEAGRDNK